MEGSREGGTYLRERRGMIRSVKRRTRESVKDESEEEERNCDATHTI